MNLNRPVGELARLTLVLAPEDSLLRAAYLLRETDLPLVPVVQERRLVGVFRAVDLVRILGDGQDLHAAVGEWMSPAQMIERHESGAAALRRMSESGDTALLVTDSRGFFAGIVMASALAVEDATPLVPPTVGGMATPFGVYLTTGTVSGGVSKWALMATGAVMFTLLAIGSFVGGWATELVSGWSPNKLDEAVLDALNSAVALGVFLVGLRVIPMSGTHGAEHQVVHAIERGEPLLPEIVSRMPRVHPRCGTNFAAGAMLFLGISSSHWIPNEEVRFLAAVVATLALWRPLGSFMQQWITTRKPSRAQLEGGIRSGEDLLEKYGRSPHLHGPVWVKIWNAGFLQVVAGSSSMYGVIWLAAKAFGWPIEFGE